MMGATFAVLTPTTLSRLQETPDAIGAVVTAALGEWGEEVNAAAYDKLSGPQDNVRSGQSMRSRIPGQYPVNVVTGHLLREQKLIYPNHDGLGPSEVAFANAADYAAVIHDHQSNARPFTEDAIEDHEAGLEPTIWRHAEERI